MDLHIKPEDCNHGYHLLDIPRDNFMEQVKMKIEDARNGEEMMCSNDKGKVTHGIPRRHHSDEIIQGEKRRRVDVVTAKTELSEIHPTFQDDNNLVVRTRKLHEDPETQSVTPYPEPSSVRDDIGHLRHLPHCVVKQEVLDADDRKVLHAYYLKEQNMDYSVHSCEDRKPAVDSPCSTAKSASPQTQCVMESHDSSTSPGLMPVRLYYNTVHLRHLVKSEGEESLPGMDIRVEDGRNVADNHAEMEAELPVCDRQREFLHARGRFDNSGQTNVYDPVCNLFSDHELHVPACDKELLHVEDDGDHHGQIGVNYPVNDLSSNPTHNGGKPHTCKFCNKTYSCWIALQQHECAGTRGKPYTCNICKQAFAKLSNLKEHELIHAGEKPYSCDICKKAIPTLRALKHHARTHTDEKPFSCNICSKAFAQLSILKNHERTHTGEKPYSCNICNKAFAQLSSLKKHERTHTGEKPYSCNICNKAFSQLNILKNHERTHTGEKPFSCNICNKTFSMLCNVKKHERTHTGEKPYSCNICNKAFSERGNLKQHEQTHANKKSF